MKNEEMNMLMYKHISINDSMISVAEESKHNKWMLLIF